MGIALRAKDVGLSFLLNLVSYVTLHKLLTLSDPQCVSSRYNDNLDTIL